MALLAAQPTFANTSTAPRVSTVRTIADAETSSFEIARHTRDTTQTSLDQAIPPSARATRELHVLATLEILHRLIMAELQVQAVGDTHGVVFEVIDALVLPPLATIAPHSTYAKHPPILRTSPEKTFVMARCVLAPPHAA